MTDKELQSYLQGRLSEYQVNDVPDFDSFFSAEDLKAAQPVASSQAKKVLWWPWFTAAVSAAAVVALLFTWPRESTVETLSSEASVDPISSYHDLSEEQLALVVNDFIAEAETLVTALEASLITDSDEDVFAAMAEPYYSGVTNPDLFSAVPSESDSKSEPATQSVSTSTAESNTLSEINAPTPYERSIEEAYAAARLQKKTQSRQAKRRASYGFSLSQNNGLLASVTPLNQNPTMDMSPLVSISRTDATSLLRAASTKNEWKIPENLTASQLRSYQPVYHYPVSFGFAVDLPLPGRFSIQTGLTYTYLHSEIKGNQENASQWQLHQSLHYIGLPLSLAMDLVDVRSWRLYASVGGGLEKGLCGVQQSHLINQLTGESSSANTIQSVAGIQPYTAASLGLAYDLSSRWQLYVQPSVHYYFDADQPMSIRSKKPFSMNLAAGFRVRL